MRRQSGFWGNGPIAQITGALLVGLVVLSGCGQSAKTPAANADPTPSAHVEPSLPAHPIADPPGIGEFSSPLSATGVGPVDYPVPVSSGHHWIYVQFACSGPGSATITNAAGRRLLSVIVKPAGSQCKSGWTYAGVWTATTQADKDIHLAVEPSMHWAMQIWLQ